MADYGEDYYSAAPEGARRGGGGGRTNPLYKVRGRPDAQQRTGSGPCCSGPSPQGRASCVQAALAGCSGAGRGAALVWERRCATPAPP